MELKRFNPTDRLTGHELRHEGAPFARDKGSRRWQRVNTYGTSGVGKAVCSCGAASAVLGSGQKRKQWHRDHKSDIRNQKEAR